MGKGATRLEAISKQNELLQEQNELLREQNELLRKSAAIHKSNEQEIFVENIDRDEMRNGFLVTSHRKKLWNVQINLIQEFARICEKHNLRWFAFYGTLLGAVRHKGFVPWDDDVDVMMLRPDYEKFKRIAPFEINPPYFFDAWYNYRLESEQDKISSTKEDLQFVTLEQEKNWAGWYPFWPILKIRDSRTAMIQWQERRQVNQGIWIDIFPIDPAPPFEEKQQRLNYGAERELFLATALPNTMRQSLESGKKSLLDRQVLEDFLNQTHRERALRFENFMLKNYFPSDQVGEFRDLALAMRPAVTYSMKDFEKVVYLPFEKIELPVPVGYENVLTANYGDWHEIKRYNIHVVDYSTDISYEEYFKTAVQIPFLQK